MSQETVTIKSEGMTLAKVIWQFFRRQPVGYLEKVLIANRGLADLGLFLPVGTKVVLPLDDVPPAKLQRNVVRLWD